MSGIALMSDPKVVAIPVAESDERLVGVRVGGRLLVDTRKQDPADAFAHLREGVLERTAAHRTDDASGRLAATVRRGLPAAFPPAGVLRGVRRPAAGRPPWLVLL